MFAMFIPSVPMISLEIVKGPSTGDVGGWVKNFASFVSLLNGNLRQSDIFSSMQYLLYRIYGNLAISLAVGSHVEPVHVHT